LRAQLGARPPLRRQDTGWIAEVARIDDQHVRWLAGAPDDAGHARDIPEWIAGAAAGLDRALDAAGVKHDCSALGASVGLDAGANQGARDQSRIPVSPEALAGAHGNVTGTRTGSLEELGE
jgi:hypothetical protein